MNPSVVAAFKDRAAADAAVDRLHGSGLATREIRVATAPDVINATTIEVDEMATGGFVGNFVKLLDGLFGTRPDGPRATGYDDLVEHEAMIVTVEVDSRQAAKPVADLLGAEGAKRVSTLPQPGLDAD